MQATAMPPPNASHRQPTKSPVQEIMSRDNSSNSRGVGFEPARGPNPSPMANTTNKAVINTLTMRALQRIQATSDSITCYAGIGASTGRTENCFSNTANFSMIPVYSNSLIGNMAAPKNPWRRISIDLRAT